jgi:hypothetical protein
MTGKQRKINQNSKLLVHAKSQRKQICNAKIFWFTYFHSFLSLFYRVSHSLVSGLRNRLFSYCPGDPRHLRFYPYPRRRESPTISSISDHDVNVKVALLSSTTVRPWIDVRPKIEPGPVPALKTIVVTSLVPRYFGRALMSRDVHAAGHAWGGGEENHDTTCAVHVVTTILHT